MYEQISNQMLAFTRNFAQTLVRANGIAVEGFEKLVDLQIKALETRLQATGEFVQEVSELRDAEGLRAVWPKGLSLVKDNAEKSVAIAQEAFGVAAKTQEAMVGLVKGSVEAANESAVKASKTVGAKARAAA